MPKVSVIGTGLVGSTYAYTLLVEGTADQICLIDANKEKALGESMDLNHAMVFAGRAEIWAGTMQDIAGSDLVAITAGSAQRPGETRMDLLQRNAKIVGSVAREIGRLAPDAIILVVTNPVDPMSWVAMRESGLPPSRVMGSGTTLDTARLRYLLGEHLGIDPKSVHATVIGEHGDSEMVAWSKAQVAGTPLDNWPFITDQDKESMFEDVRNAAYEIISMKGATYYAIALAMCRITQAVLKDSRTVYSVSTYLDGEYGVSGVYLGVPCVVGREGVHRIVELPLSPEETRRFKESARIVRKAIESLAREQERKPELAAEISEELSPGKKIRRIRRPKPLI